MYRDKTICVVVPAYNEETQIVSVIEGIPDYIDHIVIVNDASTDNTSSVVNAYSTANSRITLIDHVSNQGCGGALITGYKWCIENSIDIAVRMDGDGQMNPVELPSLLEPVATGNADYSKGNRFFSGKAYARMPKMRFYGTAFLSLLTKIVSGYWHISDFQSGYAAINKRALNLVDWDQMYKGYGQPNDLLILLNVENCRVVDVPVEPIYDVGEQSGLKIHKVIFALSWLLAKRFFWRMNQKYVIRDFHPLVFFYALGIVFGFVTIVLFARLFLYWFAIGHIPPINALTAMFSFISSSQFLLFGMWFDMESNKHLKSKNCSTLFDD